MKRVNKPSTIVTVLMWLQIVNLILGLVFMFGVFLLIVTREKRLEGVPLLAVAAVVVYVGLGVFTARSILRGHYWAWWLELLYTFPLVSMAIKTISQFKGFATPIDPESFMDNVGAAIELTMVPFFLVAPFSCIMLAKQWQRRELASKTPTEEEPT